MADLDALFERVRNGDYPDNLEVLDDEGVCIGTFDGAGYPSVSDGRSAHQDSQGAPKLFLKVVTTHRVIAYDGDGTEVQINGQ